MSVAIRVENLSKAYQIGQIGTGTISRDIERWFVTRVLGREDPFLKLGEINDRTTKCESNVVWSLKDINLEIEQGEAVGIIGRNGAGKSTLLKLLSRVTTPTTGRIKIKGRVASLLEVGTGFHPELTGRENIYLNGSILGMRKKEIDGKLDEIVDFSGVERYIDTPVKRYSSGMSVRLAFAVAAHLDSEILIVDEVLAVGDAEFQKKCLGKMEAVGQRDGRTILFVSHNMAAVQTLCRRGLLLHKSTIEVDKPISEAVGYYLQTLEHFASTEISNRTERRGKGNIRVVKIRINGGANNKKMHLATGRPAEFTFDLSGHLPNTKCIFTIYDELGNAIANFDSSRHANHDLEETKGGFRFVCRMEELYLVPGRYRINVLVACDGKVEDHVEGAAFFDVENGVVGTRPLADLRNGRVSLPHQWTLPA